MKKVKRILLLTLVLTTFSTAAHAADTPVIVSGFQTLLGDVSTWLLALIPTASAAMVGYHALMKQMSDGDPSVASSSNKSIKRVLIGGAIGTSAAGLTKAFLTYFGG